MQWLPIDTAPKDGTDILVCYEMATVPIVHIAHYDSDEHDMWEYQGSKSKEDAVGWWSFVQNSVSQHKLCKEDYNAPTHWMPLPPWPEEFYDSRFNRN